MSPLIVAMDVSGDLGSLALLRGENCLEEVELRSPEGFAHVLFGEIEALLARHGVRLTDIELFACSSGPGSFTGVRVGLTAAKGLAEATGHKMVAISNLQALASFGSRPLRAVVMDARRGEVYAAVYDDKLEAVRAEVVVKLDGWLAALPAGDLELVSLLALPCKEVVRPPQALAAAIGRLAAQRYRKGLAQNPEDVDANYVRRSDAELFWKDR